MNKPISIAQLLQNITNVPEYSPDQIQALLKRLDLTEKGLALILNVSPLTVQLWVKGVSTPGSVSRRMLWRLDKNPQVIELIAGSGENG